MRLPHAAGSRRAVRRGGLLLASAGVAVVVFVGAVAWFVSPRSSTEDGVGAPLTHGVTQVPTSPVVGTRHYVSPTGSDRGHGTVQAPWRTLNKAFNSLRPGDLLTIRGGTYDERLTHLSLARGSRSKPIQVVAAAGSQPVLKGLLWLHDADYWSVRGLNVTWAPGTSHNDHMIKFDGGNGWSFSDAEVWGAQSFAAILVTGDPSAWHLTRLFVHSTAKTHSTNQDHLIYVSSGFRGGVIERCVLADSPNGRAIKIGPPNSSNKKVGNVVVRYNTMFSNLGPSNIQLSGHATGNRIYRNILARSGKGSPNVTTFKLEGKDNQVFDNLAFQSSGILAHGVSGLIDKGGNIRHDPKFADSGKGDFRPLDKTAQGYGRYAPRVE
jgi:hypothetical protein